MADTTPHGGARPGTATVVYWLPEGATLSVQMGANISAGDVIATIPAPPTVVAFSDALRLTSVELLRIVESLDSTPIADGQILAIHRSKLRKHVVRATATGVAQALAPNGAILVRPMAADTTVTALHPGTVIAVEQDHVIVTTRVYRIGFAFSVGAAWQTAVLPRSTHAADGSSTTAPPSGTDGAQAATIVAYIDNVGALAVDRRSANGPVIAGTVSDDAAWGLLTRADQAHEREERARALVVLDGPGDAARGEQAIQPLLGLAGTSVVMDSGAREIILFTAEAFPARQQAYTDDERRSASEYIDPGRWQEACNIRGEPYIATLATGFRTLVVRTMRGNGLDERTPLANLNIGTNL